MAKVPFDINRPKLEGAKGAMLPVHGSREADGVDSYLSMLHHTMGDLAVKAYGITSDLSEAAKALGQIPPQAFSYSTMSFMPDPANYGLMQWPGLNPESLRKVSRENTTPIVIIRQRVSDMMRYASLSSYPWQPGWKISLRDPSKAPSTQEKADIKEAEKFILNCSMDGDKDPRNRDAHLISPFDRFLAGFVDDSLTFDGWAIWTDMVNDKVNAFAKLPAGMIRLALPTRGYKGNRAHFAALVDETGTPVKPFTRQELIWRVRNVRNDPSVGEYGWPECYDSATEVLTDIGWKSFKDVDIERDQVATMQLESRKFEWQRPTRKVQRSYVGRMYRIKSRSVDLLVTPGHRMLVRMHDAAAQLTVMTAEDLFERKRRTSGNNMKLPAISSWEGQVVGEKVFTATKESPFSHPKEMRMSGDDYCAFMGAYLSEGYVPKGVNRKNVYICQRKKSKGFVAFQGLLSRINGRDPYYDGGEFVMCGKALAEHVKQFGSDCYSKSIPSEIMNATSEQIQLFLDFYMLGDGRYQALPRKTQRTSRLQGVYRCITTTSQRMADQFQELAQKTGYSARIHVANRGVRRMQHVSTPNKDGAVRAYDYESETQPCYTVSWRAAETQGFDIEETTYSGEVGCVTVPNGTLYVRRNGAPQWCGNCELAIRLIQAFQGGVEMNAQVFTTNSIPNGMLLLKGDFWNQDQIDALSREWTNLKRGMSKLWGMPVMAVPEEGDVTLLEFMDLKGHDIRYRDHMNLMMGLCCLVWCFPIRRLGMFVSGGHRDNQPPQDAAIEVQQADDPGLPPLLSFVEDTINPYILWTRWPHLKFGFTAKSPKDDARQYAERAKSRTWGESRAENDLQPLDKVYPDKDLAEVMSMCPEDPIKASVYQTVAVEMLRAKLGTATAGASSDAPQKGPAMQNQKDPAESQGHGHLGGIRRNSRAEKDRAAVN